MPAEQNKKIAQELFARFTAGDVAGVLQLMSDDATWSIPGKPEQLPAAGTHSKQRVGKVFHRMMEQIPKGLRMTVMGMIAEGDRVAVEVESYGELRNGRVYDQKYHFLIVFRDGKISAVREYLDTQHAFATWVQA